MDKRDKKALVVLGVIFSIIILIVLINRNAGEEERKKTEFRDLTLVTDENTFFSVINNLNKLSNYSISDANLLKYITSDDIDYKEYEFTFLEVEEMYVISKLNLYKYYVKGNLYKDSFEEQPTLVGEKYYVLNYDITTSCFNIEIINKKKYENAKTTKQKFNDIEKNEYNKFEYTTLNNKSRALLYFNDFIKKDSKSMYELLSIATKEKYFNTYEEFENYLKKYSNISTKEFSTNNNKIAIKDNYGNEYIFDIDGILKYTVSITKTEE